MILEFFFFLSTGARRPSSDTLGALSTKIASSPEVYQLQEQGSVGACAFGDMPWSSLTDREHRWSSGPVYSRRRRWEHYCGAVGCTTWGPRRGHCRLLRGRTTYGCSCELLAPAQAGYLPAVLCDAQARTKTECRSVESTFRQRGCSSREPWPGSRTNDSGSD